MEDKDDTKCVLLLNGYSGESYWLPTEEDDLVRTLLNKGYEVWLLHMRLHFSVCTTRPFSLDDVAKFDLSAAMDRDSSADCFMCKASCPSRAQSYDAVVVGSGYGGSVAAFRLAEAGLNVCLLEKGRRWEPHEFPTTAWQTLRTTRWHIPMGIFGRSDSLYQVHLQGTVIAFVAAGLGGGSLINGGVVLPPSVRAKKDRRWPCEWNREWEASEARARAMLQPEAAPQRFHSSRAMDAVSGEIEDSTKDCVNLSVRFKSSAPGKTGDPYNACNACGNCFTGCPYNAKNSVDKNYIAAAVRVGCTVRTNCEARFVLPNFDRINTRCKKAVLGCQCEGNIGEHSRRRWRVYLGETNYITADYVVLSAGVLGTTNLLLQSKLRGLAISEKLGHRLSCNGNNVAFIFGTHVTTKADSLCKKEVEITPMFDRPGPSITTSYTSSLGFTIQGAVLPNRFFFVFFKCIAHRGFWFGLLYGVWHKMKRLLRAPNSDSLILNMMGHDCADGRIEFDAESGLVKFSPPSDPLILKRIGTVERITKRLGGQMFMPTLRNATVHLLGGCSAGRNATEGVTNSDGQIFRPVSSARDHLAADMETLVHDGLYVCDASIIPCAVGVNPSFTITVLAEHVAKCLVKDAVQYYTSDAKQTVNVVKTKKKVLASDRMDVQIKKAGARVWEKLSGRVEGRPCTLEVVMDLGDAESGHGILKGRVGGKFSMRALETGVLHIVDGTVDMCVISPRTPFTQYMHYHLLLVSETGDIYTMEAKKEMKPFLLGATALTESRTLEVELQRVAKNFNDIKCDQSKAAMRGAVRVSYIALLRSLITMRGPRRWQFVSSLLSSLFRTYLVPIPRSPPSTTIAYSESLTYPQHLIHNITTDDEAHISCWQWLPCNRNEPSMEDKDDTKCVLLLNGYSGESYWLPTEEDDLVRTLLNKGYEVWLLHMRLHFSVCTTRPFSLDDIAQFDLSAAFSKIATIRGKQAPIHVVAHCIGGLTIHMALLGGHVPISSVASLTCTNSSMFFDVTRLAMVKLFLPLIPISIKLLGEDSVLQFSGSPSESWRHQLLKRISGLIPRVEDCTCRECNLFSGIFGNAFWHENLKERLHVWLSKKTLVRLPVHGFQQLRQICMAGKVVSRDGDDKYLPYIGRLTVPTTYISGGRPLLVTPTTTERAHALMQHHHPEFRHARHVVHGYGHSDLLIAEYSARDVFPLILDGISKSGRSEVVAKGANASNFDVQRRTWEVPPSKATSFLLRLRILSCIIFVLILLNFFFV